MSDVDNNQDLIDSRDVIARIEQLQAIREPGPVPAGVLEPEDDDMDQDSLFEELRILEEFARECEDNVADWIYGATLIRDSYFEDYARELAEDIGAINSEADWPLSFIDWPAAADALKMDYAEVDFDGVSFWGRM